MSKTVNFVSVLIAKEQKKIDKHLRELAKMEKQQAEIDELFNNGGCTVITYHSCQNAYAHKKVWYHKQITKHKNEIARLENLKNN